LTYDERLLHVSESIPEFAGFHYNDSGNLVVSLKSANVSGELATTPAEQVKMTTNAIAGVFGEDILTAGLASRGVDVSIGKNVPQPVSRGTAYSFKELYSWYSVVTSLLDNVEVSFTDIDEVENRIVVALMPETSEEGEAWLTKELSKTNVPIEAVEFIEEERAEPNDTLRDRLRPLRGGSYMDFSPGSWCTLGMVVKIANEEGILTNSHCSDKIWQPDDTKYYQNYSSESNTYVGRETSDPAYFTRSTYSWCPSGYACRHSDSLFIKSAVTSVGTGTVWKTKKINSGSLEIRTTADPMDEYIKFFKMSGKEYANPPNTIIHKVGARTGWTSGEVLRSCTESYVAAYSTTADGKERYIRCNTQYKAHADGGDSGSAVFQRRIVNGMYYHIFHGLHWGAARRSDGTFLYSLYSDVESIERDLGTIAVK